MGGVDFDAVLSFLVVVDFKFPIFRSGTSIVLGAVVTSGFDDSESAEALFLIATEYTSVFFFFSSQTISDNKPSELLVVVLPASSRSAEVPSLGKSSILA